MDSTSRVVIQGRRRYSAASAALGSACIALAAVSAESPAAVRITLGAVGVLWLVRAAYTLRLRVVVTERTVMLQRLLGQVEFDRATLTTSIEDHRFGLWSKATMLRLHDGKGRSASISVPMIGAEKARHLVARDQIP